MLLLSSSVSTFAAHVVTVTPANPQGWSTADTRPGGAVTFVRDRTSPAPSGALQLTTTADPSAKAQYLHAANVQLAKVRHLSYYTKQVSSPLFAGGDPAYQLISYLNGGTSGFSTLVFEPYLNPQQGPVIKGIWQRWNVAAGQFWSTRMVTCANGVVLQRPKTYTLAEIKALCPNALVIGFGVNIGSANPSYVVETDLVNFNGTVYDFQLNDDDDRDERGERGHRGDKNDHERERGN
jgi:hypothetical protein